MKANSSSPARHIEAWDAGHTPGSYDDAFEAVAEEAAVALWISANGVTVAASFRAGYRAAAARHSGSS